MRLSAHFQSDQCPAVASTTRHVHHWQFADLNPCSYVGSSCEDSETRTQYRKGLGAPMSSPSRYTDCGLDTRGFSKVLPRRRLQPALCQPPALWTCLYPEMPFGCASQRCLLPRALPSIVGWLQSPVPQAMRGSLSGKVHGQRIPKGQDTSLRPSNARPSLLAGSRYLQGSLSGACGQDDPRVQSYHLTAVPYRCGSTRLSLPRSMPQPPSLWTLMQEDLLPLHHQRT